MFEATGDIKYLQIPIADHYSQDLAMHFPAAIQFIGKNKLNKSRYVHNNYKNGLFLFLFLLLKTNYIFRRISFE